MSTIAINRKPIWIILTGLLITTIILWSSIPKRWDDATTENADGSMELSAEWSSTVAKKQAKIANHELYMLVAAQNGYYLCGHCAGGRFFLNAGEVYRYGTTGNGKNGRGYTDNWLAKQKLNFIHLMYGDLATIMTEQATLIGSYALHPENIKRPLTGEAKAKSYWYRLVLPPGNNSLD